MISATAIVLEQPERLSFRAVDLTEPGPDDVVVNIDWTGVSTGTERLLYSGQMPAFPGMGYPLVPGYETVGRIAGGARSGERVFVPGAQCFGEIRGLFGGSASRLVVPSARAVRIDDGLGERGTLMALAATAYHALAAPEARLPELIVGHGVLGRLIARITTVLAAERGTPAPVVWETNAGRRSGAVGYEVVHPMDDDRRNYPVICDVSGDSEILDTVIACLAPGGEIVLAGFYSKPLGFAFPPAFIREARIRIAAEWKPADLTAVIALIDEGRLSLDGLITHRVDAAQAEGAYRTAFEDADCLKMIMDWRAFS
ncbi:chlorophyll synthesis pathway protein BchC [Thalassobaculum litoreum]|uniref:3-hydroxyethyl bacteriochlorophyllide a dehydrogenase n=1 Tax=Thalassobaculum litoreum DSM 18839 TaxID=1123362 RepID=A0A8G2BF03_9PROT|nr:3-hydroxyethyl bacteriochlorophyllide a dehydrogenase [Thalassobaculum litoreum DSM 18839]